ncbi:MAG: hypothetical protein U5O39_14435 [Gammaproteobacteria bacterium]|nr:hypothetical protein [Gammaproteobacteria bacterium]
MVADRSGPCNPTRIDVVDYDAEAGMATDEVLLSIFIMELSSIE